MNLTDRRRGFLKINEGIDPTVNLFDPTQNTITTGRYISYEDGTMFGNTTSQRKAISSYIPVKEKTRKLHLEALDIERRCEVCRNYQRGRIYTVLGSVRNKKIHSRNRRDFGFRWENPISTSSLGNVRFPWGCFKVADHRIRSKAVAV